MIDLFNDSIKCIFAAGTITVTMAGNTVTMETQGGQYHVNPKTHKDKRTHYVLFKMEFIDICRSVSLMTLRET